MLEFDAGRKGRLVDENELAAYSASLGIAVMDGIQYFIGNGHPYPKTHDRHLAVGAAHITHMLRDMLDDISVGFVNVPREYLKVHGIGAEDVDSEAFRGWVRDQVELARRSFREGKGYIDGLEVLRCKLAGYWYCARFERVLATIERDDYILRAEYDERRSLAAWLEMAGLSAAVTLRHFARRIRRALTSLDPRPHWTRKGPGARVSSSRPSAWIR